MNAVSIVRAGREHIDDIVAIENLCFKIPWSRQSIIDEVLKNQRALYFCAIVPGMAREESGSDGAIADFADYGVFVSEPKGAYFKACGQAANKPEGITAGYAGMWHILDEGHITNIAVHPEFRRTGVGSALMEALLGAAGELGITALTLEVRRSNFAAQSLYKKYGFEEGGMRRAYYADNKEDAIIMWKRL